MEPFDVNNGGRTQCGCLKVGPWRVAQGARLHRRQAAQAVLGALALAGAPGRVHGAVRGARDVALAPELLGAQREQALSRGGEGATPERPRRGRARAFEKACIVCANVKTAGSAAPPLPSAKGWFQAPPIVSWMCPCAAALSWLGRDSALARPRATANLDRLTHSPGVLRSGSQRIRAIPFNSDVGRGFPTVHASDKASGVVGTANALRSLRSTSLYIARRSCQR
jgi:hypothetical protein